MIGIAGAGFAGATVARILAEAGAHAIRIFDTRPHIAGNCHTQRNEETGVLVHHYGPHIFHTSREDVWAFVNRFATFKPFQHRVKATTKRGVFALPINLATINQFFNRSLDPIAAEAFLRAQGEPLRGPPMTFEDVALAGFGREIYENFFRGYTRKQWGVDPKELPASILRRLPVRFNYDDTYYASTHCGMPLEGYTELVRRMLDHPKIEVILGTPLTRHDIQNYEHVFYSGPLDAYFEHSLGRLRYRTLAFEQEVVSGDFQGTAVMNYCEESVPFTRIAEHKHFAPWETHAKSVIYREFSRAMQPGDIPYYPLRLGPDKTLLDSYCDLAAHERHVTFVGRLGTYRYLDMHAVIGESLDAARAFLAQGSAGTFPPFVHDPRTGSLIPTVVLPRSA